MSTRLILPLLFAALPMLANISNPVSVTMASAEDLTPGKPMEVIVVLESGAAADQVHFKIEPSASWMVSGRDWWSGAMEAGQQVRFTVRATPLSATPDALSGQVQVAGWPSARHKMDLSRTGRRTPEIGEATVSEEGDSVAGLVQVRAGVVVPGPETGRSPRDPRSGEVLGGPRLQPETPAKGSGARQATVSINATGRITYLDDQNATVPLGLVTVQLWDKDSAGDDLCGEAVTDANGNFNIFGSCGDLGINDRPDIYIYVVLNSTVAEVRPVGLTSGTYAFSTPVTNDFAGGVKAYGTIDAGSNLERREACHAYRMIMSAWQFMVDKTGESLPKVTVIMQAPQSDYAVGRIRLEPGDGFAEGTVAHEYGHHILTQRAESPIPNYNNGICDGGSGFADNGHCQWEPERGEIAWTEGWPDFFSGQVLKELGITGGSNISPEVHVDISGNEGQEDHIEGFVGAILEDIVDFAQDDQHGDGEGRRDNFTLAFQHIWNIVRNYDPSTSPFHQHPTSIHEFWDGMKALYPNNINRVSEIYREHHIEKPSPDLVVDSISNPPATHTAGLSISVTRTVRNAGNEVASADANVVYFLNPTGPGGNISLTSQSNSTPVNFAAGAINTRTVNVSVPSFTPPGIYRLSACVDFGQSVPESVENNNCRSSAGSVTIQ